MPRQEGLRPIGESVKKIIEKIKKEREERQKKSSSPRTQPKLPGMKRGGGVDMGDPKKPVAIPTGKDPEIMVHNLRPSDDPDFRAYAGPRRTGKDRIEKLKADLKKKPMKKMATGGGADARNPSIREYANILKDKDKVTEADMERARKRLSTETGRAVAREKIKDMKKMATGGMPEDDSEFSRRRKQQPNRGGLTRGQKKIDTNRDGKISGDDFKILRSKQKMKGGGIAIKGTNFKGVF